MKTLNPQELKEFILELYQKYLLGENVKDTARKIFLDYSGSEMLIEKSLHDAVLYLETIGWELDDSKKDVLNILKNLTSKKR